MAQLRNFQFLRNSTPSSFASYADARTAAIAAFAGINTLQDGELVLYSYKLDDDAVTVHTLLGIKRTNGIEIVANYDELTNYVDTQIQALNTTKTDESNGVSVTVTQVDGKIDSVSVVAPSLTSAIEALDVEAFSLTEVIDNELKGYKISEEDGKIVKGQTAETLLTFATAPSAINKVVTQAEIAALNANETSTNGTNVQVQVVEQAGVITGVNVVTDNTVNATDVEEAIEEVIASLDSTKSNVATLTDGATTTDIRVEVVETDGVLAAVNVTDTLAAVAHSGKAADVTIADAGNLYTATNVEAALAEVMTKANELDAAQLEAGTGIEIGTDNKINANFDIAIETRTEGEGESTTTATYIVIKDGETVIAEENANAFVKDGFLQSVTKDATNNTLVFTWNTDAGIEQTTIPISDLCDVYTAKANDWVVLNGFEFSHKEQTNFNGEGAQVTYGSVTNAEADAAGEFVKFKVPTITVDKAGHVTAMSEQEVSVTLPASIATAVQTVTAAETEVLDNTKLVAVKANCTDNDVVLTTEYRTQAVATANATADGLATANDVKTYVDGKIDVLTDYNTETTVSAAADSGIIVTPTIENADAVNEQRTYAISLTTVARADNAETDGNPSTSSFADNATSFTYVKAVHTDANGRVLGIDTETVTEFFDAGTYE